jgi:hypothetical protein
MKITTLKTLATALVCTLAAATAEAQTAPKMEMTTDIPPGIVSPDKVETRLGTLNFIDGFPDDASVAKLFDNLDFQRAVQAYLFALPPVSMASLRGAKQARTSSQGNTGGHIREPGPESGGKGRTMPAASPPGKPSALATLPGALVRILAPSSSRIRINVSRSRASPSPSTSPPSSVR